MTTYYLDTSVAVHALRGTREAEAWFDEVTAQPQTALVSSRILQVELTRVLRRDGLPVSSRADVLRHVALLAVTESVLATAESITEHVKTLDSLHLASAVQLGGDTVVVSHDVSLLRVAGVLGLATLDPLGDHSDRGPGQR